MEEPWVLPAGSVGDPAWFFVRIRQDFLNTYIASSKVNYVYWLS
jgi:hypothetical protein